MSCQYQFNPIQTPFGNAWILCQGNGRLRITTSDFDNRENSELTIFGVEYTGPIDLEDEGAGYQLLVLGSGYSSYASFHAISLKKKGSFEDMTIAARNKIKNWVVDFVNEWVKNNPYAIAHGNVAGDELTMDSNKREMDKLEDQYHQAKDEYEVAAETYNKAVDELQEIPLPA